MSPRAPGPLGLKMYAKVQLLPAPELVRTRFAAQFPAPVCNVKSAANVPAGVIELIVTFAPVLFVSVADFTALEVFTRWVRKSSRLGLKVMVAATPLSVRSFGLN